MPPTLLAPPASAQVSSASSWRGRASCGPGTGWRTWWRSGGEGAYPWYEVVDISPPGAVWLSSPTWSSVVVLPYLVQCGCPGWRWHCREWRTPKIPGLMANLLSCSWNIIVVQILYWRQVYIYPIYLKIFQPWTLLANVTVSRWEHPSIPDQSSDIFQPSGS